MSFYRHKHHGFLHRVKRVVNVNRESSKCEKITQNRLNQIVLWCQVYRRCVSTALCLICGCSVQGDMIWCEETGRLASVLVCIFYLVLGLNSQCCCFSGANWDCCWEHSLSGDLLSFGNVITWVDIFRWCCCCVHCIYANISGEAWRSDLFRKVDWWWFRPRKTWNWRTRAEKNRWKWNLIV